MPKARLTARLTAALIALSLALLSLPGISSTGFIAQQITAENISQLPIGGMDAIGGVDDWLLSNGTLCAVISASEHQTYLSLHGATLVDLWHCGRANDQWVTVHDQHNMAKEKIPKPVLVEARADDRGAEIRVVGRVDGVESITRYQFKPAQPNALEIETTLRRVAEGDDFNMLGSTILHPRGALAPFTLDLSEREYSIGFAQPAVNTAIISEILAAVSAANLQVLVGARDIHPQISYGVEMRKATLVRAGGEAQNLKQFIIGSETFTILGFFSEPLWAFTRKPSGLTFLRGQFMDLEEGDEINYQRRITVGDRADAASVTDQIYQGSWITGKVDTKDAGIRVFDGAGHSLTFVRTDAEGNFKCRLPSNTPSVELQVDTAWSSQRHRYAVDDVEQDLGLIKTGGFATVTFPEGLIASVIFKGVNGTPDPILMNSLTGLSVGGEPLLTGPENNRISLAGSAADIRTLFLPVGDYRVIASRGIEYSLTETVLTAKAGDIKQLDLPSPVRAIATEGLIAADFHVHSGASMDSSLLPQQRVLDFVAQGGEVLVATEHNITYDLQPLIEEMGLSDRVVSFAGVEITGMARSEVAPTAIGHSNVFPVEADRTKFRGGTLDFEGKRLGQVISSYKAEFPDSIFQLNHPRANAYDADTAFFNHLSIGKNFDAEQALDAEINRSLLEELPNSTYRDIDFDAVELLNGETISEYFIIREDWFSLLRQGFFKVGTGNSDSHLSEQLVALPRNYLMVDEDISNITTASVIAAVKSARLFATTGPMLKVSLDDDFSEYKVSGELFQGSKGTLKVSVGAVNWINIDTLNVFVNGVIVHTQTVQRGDTIEVGLNFEQDSFVTIEVTGQVTELYAIVAPGYLPIAFSNPIFVDVAGDGYSAVSAVHDSQSEFASAASEQSR